MKKSRIAKLALMGASITALAATLTTSTYAWYVSNKTANVNAVNGQTDSAAGDGSISLSTSGKSNEYYKTISLDAAANYNGVDTNVMLAPVTTSTGNTFIKDNEEAAAATAVYKYEFYVKSEEDCEIIPTITVSNTTQNAEIPYQINYSAGEASSVTGVEKGASFTIDALNALYISQSTEVGKTYSSQTKYEKADSQTGAISTPQANAVTGGGVVKASYSAAITALDKTKKATGGAHAYYKEIMSVDPAHVEANLYAKPATAIGNITLKKDTPQKVTYYLWLDGADDQCFNACAGQKLSVAFSYTVKAKAA